jgi:hypothetical protein
MKKSHEKILEVMKVAGRPLTEYEFRDVTIHRPSTAGSGVTTQDGRSYVNESDSAIGRRMREMRVLGLVSSQKRVGKKFKEYLPVFAEVPVGAR